MLWTNAVAVLTFLTLAVNWLAKRHARNEAAFVLSMAFVAAWGVTNGLRALLPLPWAWFWAGPIDFGLLWASAYINHTTKSEWAWALCMPLLIGCALQVTLWLMWLPHRMEPYNPTLYGIYNQYWLVTMTLASVELLYLIWPGGKILAAVGARSFGSLFAGPVQRRHSH